jgi:hypothetical protein
MVTCGFCKHPGIHATTGPSIGGIHYCTGCPKCQRLLAEAKQQEELESEDD